MVRELNHMEVQELLGAYALDAVDDDERLAVERHLETCQSCRVEVTDHREVAGLLAAGWVPAPEGVWDRIAGELEGTPPAVGAPVVPLGAARERRKQRARGPVRAAVAISAAVAVGVISFLGVKVIDTSQQVDNVAQQLTGEDLTRVAEAAARRPDARQVALISSDQRLSAEAVLLSDGTGYLVKANLPPLPPERTYQLWAVMGGAKISVGVLGTSAGPVAFRAAGNVQALAITEEVAGGVVSSFQQPTVVGTLA